MATLNNSSDNVNFITAIGGVQPAALDTVVINKFATKFTTGLTVTNDLAKLSFGKEFKGSIESGNLVFTANNSGAGVVEVRSSGTRLRLSAGAVTNKHAITIINPNGNTTVDVYDTLQDELHVVRGTANVNDSVDSNDVVQAGGILTLDATGTHVTTSARIMGGECKILRQVTTLQASGSAKITFDNDAVSQGTLHLANDMTIVKGMGTVTYLYLYRGTIDLSGATKPITFTNYKIYEGAKVILPTGWANPFTDTSKFRGNPTFVTQENA